MRKEKILSPVDIIVSQSDLNGFIIYANPIFYKIAGYDYGELLGKNHNIIRDPEMPKVIFKHLWEALHNKQAIYCFIKNRSKDQGFYWVYAYIRPSFNPDGSMRNYISTRRAISPKARAIIQPLYKNLLDLEKTQGVDASEEYYRRFIHANQYHATSHNEVIQNIQF